MTKRKTIWGLAIAILLVLLIGLGVYFAAKEYTKDLIDFPLGDTLPDGEGRHARVILLGGQSNASGCSHDEYLKKTATPEKYAEYERVYSEMLIIMEARRIMLEEQIAKLDEQIFDIYSKFGELN